MSRTLIIGNKNYSSWSLRAWLALKEAGVEFDEQRIALDRPQTKAEILRHSPSGKVPCLVDGPLMVWDSLAICETANERYAGGALWPADVEARAHARAVTAEMHSGFAALRTYMPMDIRSSRHDTGATAAKRADVSADIARIQAIWSDCLGAQRRAAAVWRILDRRCVLCAGRHALPHLRRDLAVGASRLMRIACLGSQRCSNGSRPHAWNPK